MPFRVNSEFHSLKPGSAGPVRGEDERVAEPELRLDG